MLERRAIDIEGVVVVELRPHDDERGSFTELYRREWLAGTPPMIQANQSLSAPGTLRGLHFHRRQADYWCVTTGAGMIGLYDLRAGSPSEGRPVELQVDGARFGVYIPAGVAHGLCATTEVSLTYLVDRYFDGTDEFGVAWDDPALGISWPVARPILSARDRANPPLNAARAHAPPYSA